MDSFEPDPTFVRQPARTAKLGRLGKVCRLGLATRGNTRLEPEGVLEAVRRGIDYLNWCGHSDGMSAAIRQMGEDRRNVFVAVQFSSRRADGARREIRDILAELGTDYVDVLTYYYVEHPSEWAEILAPGGAAEVLEAARHEGTVRAIGVTSHQRSLAAEMARSGRVDLLMIRYNAAHVGAERDIFPVTQSIGLPVVTYTGLRWGALLGSTPSDPPGFVAAPASDWYRFVVCHPAVTVGLMAPNGEEELEKDLQILDDWRGFDVPAYQELRAHGQRTHQHGRAFP